MHTLQRLLNIRMGLWGIEEDTPPYRAMGPVTEEEYLYREKHYDTEIEKYTGIDHSKKKLKDRIEILRKAKYELFEDLQQKVYAARGWDERGVPTVETLKRLKIDFPEAIELVNSVK
jgi:aldehyde:ferredoxin oxidoreductase